MDGETHGLACFCTPSPPSTSSSLPVIRSLGAWRLGWQSTGHLLAGARSIPLINSRAVVKKSWVPRCHKVLVRFTIVISVETSTRTVFILHRRPVRYLSSTFPVGSIGAPGNSAAGDTASDVESDSARMGRGRPSEMEGGLGCLDGKHLWRPWILVRMGVIVTCCMCCRIRREGTRDSNPHDLNPYRPKYPSTLMIPVVCVRYQAVSRASPGLPEFPTTVDGECDEEHSSSKISPRRLTCLTL